MTSVRLTATGGAGHWHGALRLGSRTLADCGHSHRNRDSGSGGAARTCITTLVRAARDRDGYLTSAWLGAAVASAATARRMGARITDEEARAKAQTTLDAVRDVVVAHDFHLPVPAWQAAHGFTCGCCRPSEENR